MDQQNESLITEFILQGFTDNPKMQLVVFMVFLSVYAITVLGNLGMILLICTQPQLHKPMYYFLGNLSFVDLCCSSTIAPKMLSDLLSATKRISSSACAAQLFLYAVLVDVECLLLALMAYDRYVAICNPLLYSTAMSKKTCQQLIAIAYLIGLLDSTIHTSCTFLSFCSSNIINHFFCDEPPLLIFSCSDTYINEIMLFISVSFVEATSVSMILVSYIYILVTVLRMCSAEGRRKAFSTCASHLMAVGIFHGTILYMYFRPTSSYSMDQDKWASVLYTVVIPMLNPLIYSLRNKEVKDAVSRSFGNIWIFKFCSRYRYYPSASPINFQSFELSQPYFGCSPGRCRPGFPSGDLLHRSSQAAYSGVRCAAQLCSLAPSASDELLLASVESHQALPGAAQHPEPYAMPLNPGRPLHCVFRIGAARHISVAPLSCAAWLSCAAQFCQPPLSPTSLRWAPLDDSGHLLHLPCSLSHLAQTIRHTIQLWAAYLRLLTMKFAGQRHLNFSQAGAKEPPRTAR
ncbi:LOW QUALITY PROTEIN: olfactory receptor 5AR1-like [Liasis olivaceus]